MKGHAARCARPPSLQLNRFWWWPLPHGAMSEEEKAAAVEEAVKWAEDEHGPYRIDDKVWTMNEIRGRLGSAGCDLEHLPRVPKKRACPAEEAF